MTEGRLSNFRDLLQHPSPPIELLQLTKEFAKGSDHRIDNTLQCRRHRMAAQDVVHHDLKRPGRRRSHRDFQNGEHHEHDDAAPVRPEARERPGDLLHISLHRAPVRACARRSGTADEGEAASAVTPSGLASFTYSQPAG